MKIGMRHKHFIAKEDCKMKGRKMDRQLLGVFSGLISCCSTNLRPCSEHPRPWWDLVVCGSGGAPVYS